MTTLRKGDCFHRAAGLLWTMAWILELALGNVSPALAQRRRAEPEANPQFQNDVQGSAASTSGQPVAPEAAAAPSRPAAPSEPAPTPMEEEKTAEIASTLARSVPSVQIGAATNPSDTVPIVRNPMDSKVTVRVKEATLAVFLETISAQAKVNFIITEGLEKKRITAYLQNVTVREALQILLEIKGLTYQRIGSSNTYIVSPRSRSAPNRITRIYTLSYVSLIPLMNAAATGGGSQLPITMNLIGGAGSGGGSSSGGGGAGSQAMNDKDGAISIIAVIKSVLSKDGTMAIDPRSNDLIVTDIPEVFPQVEQIIAELDKKSPQLMIEAQIVEINSDKTQDLGFDWGGPNGQLATFTGGARDTLFPLSLPSNLSQTHFFGPVTNVSSALQGSAGGSGSGSSSGGASASGSLGTTGVSAGPTVGGSPVLTSLNTGTTLRTSVLDLTNLTVVLRALVSRSEARFLGKPKVLTLNNQTATIQITQDQAVGIAQTSVSVGSAGSGASASTSLERYNTGLTLRVTPQVNKEGYITMLVQPSFTNVVASVISVAGGAFDPVTRTASTMVRVKNGQTMVLGGLLSSRESKVVRKVPFLGYIPIVGWLFTSVSTQRDNTDLVIFLTPTIVND